MSANKNEKTTKRKSAGITLAGDVEYTGFELKAILLLIKALGVVKVMGTELIVWPYYNPSKGITTLKVAKFPEGNGYLKARELLSLRVSNHIAQVIANTDDGDNIRCRLKGQNKRKTFLASEIREAREEIEGRLTNK